MHWLRNTLLALRLCLQPAKKTSQKDNYNTTRWGTKNDKYKNWPYVAHMAAMRFPSSHWVVVFWINNRICYSSGTQGFTKWSSGYTCSIITDLLKNFKFQKKSLTNLSIFLKTIGHSIHSTSMVGPQKLIQWLDPIKPLTLPPAIWWWRERKKPFHRPKIYDRLGLHHVAMRCVVLSEWIWLKCIHRNSLGSMLFLRTDVIWKKRCWYWISIWSGWL